MLVCEWCKKRFSKKRKLIKHINVIQEESIHIFCSQDCKGKWMFSFQTEKYRKGIKWLLGTYKGHSFFLKKYVKIPINKEKNSWFSEEINHLLPLKLVKRGRRRILKVKMK